MRFKDRLRELRIKNDITQLELGKKLGLSESTISLYESGSRKPEPDTLIALSKIFNVSVDYLLGQTDDPTPPSDEIIYMPTRKEFSKRIKLLREEKNLTQDELADRLEIGRGSIAMYETGKRMPPADTLVKIALYFNVSLEYLLGLTDSRKRVTLTREEIEAFLGPGDYPDLVELAYYIKKENLTVEQVKEILETVKKLRGE